MYIRYCQQHNQLEILRTFQLHVSSPDNATEELHEPRPREALLRRGPEDGRGRDGGRRVARTGSPPAGSDRLPEGIYDVHIENTLNNFF